ncbi:unnamed protein product [Cylindrotheca closterium]|uniref:LOV domain-containing protein n=1 Tax=Cylindrotheca closterium TaxID=2856 RepID=A0AAD2G729_9STRA|nr:unnamed protein product [Cylindrotheca closterium]
MRGLLARLRSRQFRAKHFAGWAGTIPTETSTIFSAPHSCPILDFFESAADRPLPGLRHNRLSISFSGQPQCHMVRPQFSDAPRVVLLRMMAVKAQYLEDNTSGAPASFEIDSSSTLPAQNIESAPIGTMNYRKMQESSARSDSARRNILVPQPDASLSASIASRPSIANSALPKQNDCLTKSTTQPRLESNPDFPTHNLTKRQRTENSSVSINATQLDVASQAPQPPDAIAGRGRKKTQAQIDRRRERNRILARRTRLRKKFFFESLQKEVVDLQRENAALKDIVRSKLDENGTKILEDCSAAERLPDAVLETCGEHSSDIGQQDFNLVRSIQQSQHSFVITDPSLQDHPIVFASDEFLKLTGYSREEVLGRNCRFLQGVDTCPSKVQDIRKGISAGSDVSVTLLNYTSDGTPFWNQLFIAALRDAQDDIVNFIGVMVKVTSPNLGDAENEKSFGSTG